MFLSQFPDPCLPIPKCLTTQQEKCDHLEISVTGKASSIKYSKCQRMVSDGRAEISPFCKSPRRPKSDYRHELTVNCNRNSDTDKRKCRAEISPFAKSPRRRKSDYRHELTVNCNRNSDTDKRNCSLSPTITVFNEAAKHHKPNKGINDYPFCWHATQKGPLSHPSSHPIAFQSEGGGGLR
ncbi:hypothetical protein CEXT_448871 [Caerostris extrusa]|uniref:Uncharacterized protein n=1 Tax=Caerostris extrusa TaxID=172846 RepID=A0AAV4PQY9_CAEEX|nr:hypothetical protein CEXT_448871 [Caerostris extrusa]